MATTEELQIEVDEKSPESSPNISPSPAVNGHKGEEGREEPAELTIDVSGATELNELQSEATAQDGGDNSGSVSQTPKSPSDTASAAENGSVRSPSSANNASPSASLSDSKIKKARNKFEQQGSFEKKTGRRKEKVKYAGLSSAKNRFMDAASADERKPVQKRKQKRITPPRDGNLTGVVESQPTERDPNVVRSDMFTDDDVKSSDGTKSARERFREMEKGGNASEGDERRSSKVDVDTAVTKNLRDVWKTRETNPEPTKKERKSQIKIREEVEGGVYENQPEVLTDVVRAGDQPEEDLASNVDTRARRDQFLRQASEATRTKKLNALEEISELAKREQNVVYENQPAAPVEGVVRGNYEDDREPAHSNINTKELRQRFLKNEDQPAAQKQPINIREGEGGVYENAPEERNDIVKASDAHAVNPLDEVGQWASEAKLRFMEDAGRLASTLNKDNKRPIQLELAEGGVFENEPIRREGVVRADEEVPQDSVTAENTVKSSLQRLQELKEQASRVQTSKAPVILAEDKNAGVYENVPASSKADYSAAAMMEVEAKAEGKFATDAKKLFLQKQAEEEEARKNKAAPQMIDIWSDLCKDSGVFENRPVERDPNVVRALSEEDEEEEEEEEEEEGEEEEGQKE